ncbi:MAG: FecCD family ABC transporter permease [Candidatus Methanomethylophilaceae archaeon]|jgi:iron complex transport system permease protein
MNRKKRILIVSVALVILFIIAVSLDLSIAVYRLSFKEVLLSIFGKGTPYGNFVVRDLNAPRVAMGCFVGAALGISGAVMQGLFRNPMASPYTLGLSSGASFGAAFAIVAALPFIALSYSMVIFAFIFGLLTMMLVYSISKVGGRVPTETLLLSGIAVGALFSALVSLLTYLAEDQMEGIVFWSMGNLDMSTWNNVVIVAPMVIIGILISVLHSRDLNAIMIGDSHAMDLGVNVGRSRLILLIAISMATSASVAFVGTIGFVGLVVPHIIRILVGPDNRILIPMSALGGAGYLILCDYVSKIVLSVGSLPVGIITSLIGAPYFIYLLRRRKSEVGW